MAQQDVLVFSLITLEGLRHVSLSVTTVNRWEPGGSRPIWGFDDMSFLHIPQLAHTPSLQRTGQHINQVHWSKSCGGTLVLTKQPLGGVFTNLNTYMWHIVAPFWTHNFNNSGSLFFQFDQLVTHQYTRWRDNTGRVFTNLDQRLTNQ